MADNYLERRMEEYRSGKFSSRPKAVRTVSRGEGDLVVHFPKLRVLIAGGLDAVGRAIVGAFRQVDCRVAFFDTDYRQGNLMAQSTGSKFYHTPGHDSLARNISDILDKWGGIDVVVNNMDDDTGDVLAECMIRYKASIVGNDNDATYGGRFITVCRNTEGLFPEGLAQYGMTVNRVSISAGEAGVVDSFRGSCSGVAHICMFIASPDSGFLNGVDFPVTLP